MAQAFETYLDNHERRMCRLLRDLIRIPTINPPGLNYARCVEFLQDRLGSLGLTTRVVRVPTAAAARIAPQARQYPRMSLIGRWDVGAARTVHFNAHYDVVPAAGRWRDGPFAPRVRGGWLHGRGSGDMKGAIACICLAIEALRESGVTPRMNVEVSFTPDEETGGELGAGYIVRHGHVKADYAVVMEGGGKKGVGVGHNGVLWFEATVRGKAAHASVPKEGLNAFEKMAELTMQLQLLKAALAKRRFRAPDGKVMHPTLNLGGVFGVGDGAKINTVPALATFTMDRRVVPGERLRDAEHEIRRAFRRARTRIRKLRVDLARRMAIAPCMARQDGALPQAFARAVRPVYGGPVKFSVTTGFTDMHFFAIDGKIPTIGYGPGGKGGHAINERAKPADLLATAKVYARFLAEGMRGTDIVQVAKRLSR